MFVAFDFYINFDNSFSLSIIFDFFMTLIFLIRQIFKVDVKVKSDKRLGMEGSCSSWIVIFRYAKFSCMESQRSISTRDCSRSSSTMFFCWWKGQIGCWAGTHDPLHSNPQTITHLVDGGE
jgi:hypothetical protein